MSIKIAKRLLLSLSICSFLSMGAFASSQSPIPGDGPALDPAAEAALRAEKEKAKTITPPPAPTLQSVREDVITCVRASDSRARLRCYDEIAGKLGVAPSEWKETETGKVSHYGFWNIVDKKNELNQNVIFLTLPSENLLKDSYGNTRTPDLNIKCVNRKTEAYVDWKGLINKEPNQTKFYVEYFIGNAPDPTVESWNLSRDQFALFSADPVSFVRKLKGEEKFVMRFTPTGEKQASLAFDLRGFDKALEILVKRCYAS